MYFHDFESGASSEVIHRIMRRQMRFGTVVGSGEQDTVWNMVPVELLYESESVQWSARCWK